MGVATHTDHEARRLELSPGEFADRLTAHGHDAASIDRLWHELTDTGSAERVPTLRSLGLGPSIAVYLGVLLLLAAIASVLAIYWETLSPWAVSAIGAGSIVGFVATAALLRRQRLEEPAGVLEAVAVCLVPLVVYGVEEATGLWPADTDVDYIWSGITVIALATAVAAIGMLWWRRSAPLPLVPLAAATAVLAADASEVVLGSDATPRQHYAFVLPVGVFWLAGGLWLDARGRRSFATWAHWAGLAITSASVMVLVPKTVPGFAVVGLLGAAALFFSAFVRHWSFTVVGAMGVLVAVGGALGMLGGTAPLALVLLGVAFLVAGLRWARWRERLRVAVLARLPARVRSVLVRLAPP